MRIWLRAWAVGMFGLPVEEGVGVVFALCADAGGCFATQAGKVGGDVGSVGRAVRRALSAAERLVGGVGFEQVAVGGDGRQLALQAGGARVGRGAADTDVAALCKDAPELCIRAGEAVDDEARVAAALQVMQHCIKRFACVQHQRQVVATGDVDLRGEGGALRGAVAPQEIEAAFADGDGCVVLDLAFQRVQVVVLVFALVERMQAVAGVNAGQRGATGDVRPMRARGRGNDDAVDASGGGFGSNCRRVGEPVEVAMAVGVGEGHGFLRNAKNATVAAFFLVGVRLLLQCADALACQGVGVFGAAHRAQGFDEAAECCLGAVAVRLCLEVGAEVAARHVVVALGVVGVAKPVLGLRGFRAAHAAVQVLFEGADGAVDVAGAVLGKALFETATAFAAALCGGRGFATARGDDGRDAARHARALADFFEAGL